MVARVSYATRVRKIAYRQTRVSPIVSFELDRPNVRIWEGEDVVWLLCVPGPSVPARLSNLAGHAANRYFQPDMWGTLSFNIVGS